MRTIQAFVALMLGAVLWLPQVHRVFTPSAEARARLGAGLAEHQLRQIERLPPGQREMAELGRTNPEWELLGRGFLALALADRALAEPALGPRHLAALDRLIDETLDDERRGGAQRFLLAYGRRAGFGVSLFVDSQIALMLAARQHVAVRAELQAPLAARIGRLAAAMAEGPPGLAESYPDECWMYDHTGALAALRLWDALSGEDHRALGRSWLAMARERLVDPATGLLVSSFRRSGEVLDGPEGSSLWVSVHNLALVDPAFAREQYERARGRLRRDVLGFTVAREWPDGAGRHDIDSGPVVPGLEASPGSSGLLLVA
ncbi:MAG: hypothetical protein EOO75_07075, partial [Myxococcales bacterium]